MIKLPYNVSKHIAKKATITRGASRVLTLN